MSVGARPNIADGLTTPYQGYVYAYPHKSAYRPFTPARRLGELWAGEPRENLFLYLHLPFCEMRCGFCNLFTTANPAGSLVSRYLRAIEREAEAVRSELGGVRAARLAIGGGTPTFLDAPDLAQVLDLVGRVFGADPRSIPASVETSPKTATAERLDLLAERGVERISIGVQSFVDAEVRAIGRPQSCAQLEAALDAIRTRPFRRLNIDLIYGAAGQTPDSWRRSIRRALEWRPEEIYLYPLYVRPRTGLDGRAEVWDEHRLSLYRAGRALLLREGYEQVSMRMFRRSETFDTPTLEYCCQEDGMLGLGAGARSYTRASHYATDYAVSRRGVLAILDDYCNRRSEDHREANFGIELDRGEQMRRYILKSILRADGLDRRRFALVFGTDPCHALPELRGLADAELLRISEDALVPTEFGLERSDAIGPWLYSRAVRARMAAYETT